MLQALASFGSLSISFHPAFIQKEFLCLVKLFERFFVCFWALAQLFKHNGRQRLKRIEGATNE
jgi:hypothetical protein